LGWPVAAKNEPVTPAADDASKAAASAADAAKKGGEAAKAEAAKTADAAKTEAARVADAAKTDTADAAKAADNNKTQGLIDKAKSLIAEGKFSDAASVLQQLAGQSLSSDQQKIVDGLKEQLQKALAGNAAGNVGNLLKK